MINKISPYILPLIVLIILIYAYTKKVDIFSEFVSGVKESYNMILNMFPNILGMLLGINIFLKSNILNTFLKILTPITNLFSIPIEVLPLAIMRPISGSSSLAILNEIYANYGVDSIIGKMASVIQGSTDTTIYIIMLYFGAVGITKIRHSLYIGLLADLCSIIISITIVKLLFT